MRTGKAISCYRFYLDLVHFIVQRTKPEVNVKFASVDEVIRVLGIQNICYSCLKLKFFSYKRENSFDEVVWHFTAPTYLASYLPRLVYAFCAGPVSHSRECVLFLLKGNSFVQKEPWYSIKL
jgi:hypothetical protein